MRLSNRKLDYADHGQSEKEKKIKIIIIEYFILIYSSIASVSTNIIIQIIFRKYLPTNY